MRPQFRVDWDPVQDRYVVTSTRHCSGDCDLHDGDDAGIRLHISDAETVAALDRVCRVIGVAAARGFAEACMADVH